MLNRQVDEWLNRVPLLDKVGDKIAHTVHGAVLQGGGRVRSVVDLLHGTWLGHPLHPVLIETVIGAWTFGTVFDVISLIKRSPQSEQAADRLISMGNVAAVPTMMSGLADYSTIPHPATRAGLVHATINNIGFILQLLSAMARKRGSRKSAIALSGTASLLMLIGAYLGGHLVYGKKVGVDHADPAEEPASWRAAMAAEGLEEATPQRVQVEGNPVLLYRRGRQVQAIGAVCPHAGAPLENGKFYDGCVQCPWHDSVFNLEDGRVIHGPSTYAVANYEARIHDGNVEVRVAQG